MNFEERIPRDSLIFAPMEGITDGPYRLSIDKIFPEWDYYFCDFLRVPSQGHYSDEKILHHYGREIISNKRLKRKTGYQILTTERAQTNYHVTRLHHLGFDHIDLNLGCPSKKVNSHRGGAYLLSDLKALANILKEIRSLFPGLFTVKIRLGYRNEDHFEDILKLIQDEGIDAVTIHARTRDQLYEGKANWKYLEKAVRLLNIPVIGNGDIWTIHDIQEMKEQTGCHSIMVARGALKTPWLAEIYKENKHNVFAVNEDYLLHERKKYLDSYFETLENLYLGKFKDSDGLLRRFKAFSRYLFEDYQDGDLLKSRFLRSRSLEEFKNNLQSL